MNWALLLSLDNVRVFLALLWAGSSAACLFAAIWVVIMYRHDFSYEGNWNNLREGEGGYTMTKPLGLVLCAIVFALLSVATVTVRPPSERAPGNDSSPTALGDV